MDTLDRFAFCVNNSGDEFPRPRPLSDFDEQRVFARLEFERHDVVIHHDATFFAEFVEAFTVEPNNVCVIRSQTQERIRR